MVHHYNRAYTFLLLQLRRLSRKRKINNQGLPRSARYDKEVILNMLYLAEAEFAYGNPRRSPVRGGEPLFAELKEANLI